MSLIRLRRLVLAGALLAGLGAPLAARASQADARDVTGGAVLFRQECVYCHGVGARGGMRGPDLTTGAWTHGGSDAELTATITDGVPGTAMPPHKLTEDEVRQIVTYLRSIQQPAAQAAGDAKRGETLFAAQRCASCHMV